MRFFGLGRFIKITKRGIRPRALTRIPGAIRAAKIATHGFTHPFRNLLK